jgi:hypothetical protein
MFYRDGMMGKNQQVVKSDKRWAIQCEGNSRDTSVHRAQKEAIEATWEISKKQRSELLIHGRDGKTRERNSYGNDPHHPKD